VMNITFEGNQATLVTMPEHPQVISSGSHRYFEFNARPIDLTSSGIKLGSPTPIDSVHYYMYYGVRTTEHPEVSYSLGYSDKTMDPKLYDPFAIRISTPEVNDREAVTLWAASGKEVWPRLWTWQNKIYVMGSHLVILDVSEPLKPRVISDTPFKYSFDWFAYPIAVPGGDRIVLLLPPVPDFPPRERLNAAIGATFDRSVAFEGDILCTGRNILYAYKLKELNSTTATFEKIGQYQPTLLEKVFGVDNSWGIQLKNGLVYEGGGSYGPVFNTIISIFDTASRPPMKMIGHFAAPGVQGVCPLPDGRALFGGSKLWLVGPPPHRDSQ
jgi:hypothetical protein